MRHVKPVSLAALLLLVPVFAAAQEARLAWRACPGSPASSATESFSCDRNTTPEGDPVTFRLVGSFTSPIDIPQFVGLEAIVDVANPEAALPDFWRLGTGECREGSLQPAFAYGALGLCTSPFTGGGLVSGGHTWSSGYESPNRARLRVQAGTSQPGPIVAGVFYTALDVRLDAAHAVADADPACGGCCTPVCLVLSRVVLYDAAFGAIASVGDQASGFIAGWNGQASVATPIGCSVVGGCPTRSGSNTWGAIKSLYR